MIANSVSVARRIYPEKFARFTKKFVLPDDNPHLQQVWTTREHFVPLKRETVVTTNTAFVALGFGSEREREAREERERDKGLHSRSGLHPPHNRPVVLGGVDQEEGRSSRLPYGASWPCAQLRACMHPIRGCV